MKVGENAEENVTDDKQRIKIGGKFGGRRRKSGENKELSKKEELKEKENVLKKVAYQAIILQ